MVDIPRAIAGAGVMVVAGLLVMQGEFDKALYLVLPTVGFFIGEKNGERKTSE